MAKNNIIGTNIKNFRKEKNLTQKELAVLVGKTESSIQKYEAGKVEIPTSVLHCIAEKLGHPFIEFYGLDSEKFMKQINESNRDPVMTFLNSIGYNVTLDDNGKLFITISGQTIPLMRDKYQLLKEQIVSFSKAATESILK